MELLVATAILMTISAIVTQVLLQMMQAQATIWNRTEMHSGIRGATELLQQEVGQAGRVGVPNTITLLDTINDVGGASPQAQANCNLDDPTSGLITVHLSSVVGLWSDPGPPGSGSYVSLTILDGPTEESVRVDSVNVGASTITACFEHPHAAGATLAALGAFATGIVVPKSIVADGNGSTDWVLKLYGDINGDGKMVYVEYTCVDKTVGPDLKKFGDLTRSVMPFDQDPATKPTPQILLSNVIGNPDPNDSTKTLPCFNYQTIKVKVQGTDTYFVLDVAVTLTVQTTNIDPITKTYQKETKALLNVSPRNVFNAWELASIGMTDRIQSMPVTVAKLLP